MPTGINLTPPQELKRQQVQFIVGAAVKATAVLLVLALGAAGYLFYKSGQLKGELRALDQQQTDLLAQKASMREVEDYSKKISGKYFLLQKYLQSRIKYSAVLAELLTRVPETIVLDGLDFGGADKKAQITGTSKDLVTVSALVNGLAKEGNSSSDSAVGLAGKNAFTAVSLDSLNVTEGESVDFVVSFTVTEENFLQ
jgi:Tfp pilus assembly protein PilN